MNTNSFTKIRFIRHLFLLVMLLIMKAGMAANEILFAPLPLEDTKIIQEQFHGMVQYLQQKTGYKITMVHYKDYAQILEDFKNNKIDLAFLGPLPYVILKRDFSHQEPVSCFRDSDGTTSYTCSLIVFGSDESLNNKVQNAHIGLTQPYSTCGYLAVTQMLNKMGTAIDADGNTFDYAGSHSNAALGVARGEYDIAGVKTAIAKRYEHLNLIIIQTSTPFPGFSLIANTNRLTPATIQKIRTVLLSLDPLSSKADRKLMEKWGKGIKNGAVSPPECDYQPVMETLKKMPWPIPGSGE